MGVKLAKRKIVASLLLSLLLTLLSSASSFARINDPNATSQALKILVIEINPVLNTIPGRPKVSEWFGHDVTKSINELMQDIDDSSHGYLKPRIVKHEYLNEFPTYLQSLSLVNGKTAKRYDEATYIKMSRSSTNPNRGDWLQMTGTSLFKQVDRIGAGNFDYDYLIRKFNLIARRNNGEFDQVWIMNISPIGTYETMMVGRSAFWVNGEGKTYDCDNFIIAGFEIARSDSMMHSLGHMTENIMRNIYSQPKDIYKKQAYNVNSKQSFQNLNDWEKFSLTSFNNNANFTGVGNTHFTFSSADDYDYSNQTKVKSNWREWQNYPNVTGAAFEYSNWDTIRNHQINKKVLSSSTQTKEPDRLYQRFWFNLLPHIPGYNSDGRLRNWWKYIYSLDFVKTIRTKTSSESIYIAPDSFVPIEYSVIYNSGKTETYKAIPSGNNVKISNKNVVDFVNGKLRAKAEGQTKITVYYDGKSASFNITVSKNSAKYDKDESNVSDNSVDDNDAQNNAGNNSGANNNTENNNNNNEIPPSNESYKNDSGLSTNNEEACRIAKNRGDPNYKIICGDGSEEKAENIVKSVLQAVFFWAGILATIVIIIGGYFYITSQGEPEKVIKAKNTILYAIVGLVIALVSFAIVTFVLDKIA